MKNFKSLVGLLLALIVVLGMMAPALAAEEKGTITITHVVKTEDTKNALYKVYKILDLESYEAGKPAVGDQQAVPGKYSYKVNSAWTGFFTGEGKGLAYMTITDDYVYWRSDVAQTETNINAFAEAALQYAKDNNIAPVGSSEDMSVTADGKLVFSGLELGYYLVDSSVGALCALTTTNPSATFESKNKAPTIQKAIVEGTDHLTEDHVSIGDVVKFVVAVDVYRGSENFVFHDKMTEGLTFDPESIEIKHKEQTASDSHTVNRIETIKLDDGTEKEVEYYEVITEDITDECTFEIKFKDSFMDHLNNGDKIYIYYEATLNEKAEIADGVGDEANKNAAKLGYGDEHYTTTATTETKTFAVDVVKTDEESDFLNGAEFTFYKKGQDAEGKATYTPVKLVNNGSGVYRIAVEQTGADVDDSRIVVSGGKIRIEGLGAATYALQEEVAPKGYNKVDGYTEFVITNESKLATVELVDNEADYVSGGIQVVNKTGNILPSTGGIGTTLFYAIGGVLVAAAVVLLVTRKRMNQK